MSRGVPRISWSLFAAALLVSGCSGKREFSLAGVSVERQSWDSVRVYVAFTSAGALGGERQIASEAITLKLFDSSYGLLFEGPGPGAGIPDARLGSREEIIIEACGEISGVVVCEQRMLRASPKRLRWRKNLTYPVSGRIERGRYDFDFRVERQQFGGEEWEPLTDAVLPGAYLVASVPGWSDTEVRIPIEDESGSFDLTRQPNYQEYQFRLTRAISRDQRVPVRFDVYAGFHKPPVLLTSLERTVRLKSEADRERDVDAFVDQVAEIILAPFEPYDRAYVYVERWSFEESDGTYRIPLRIQWDRRSRNMRRVDGLLTVREDGSQAIFERQTRRRRIERLWKRTFEDADRIALGSLSPPEQEPAPEQGAEALAML